MAKKARRVPRRVAWQDEFSLGRIDEIIAHFTACRDLYQQSHAVLPLNNRMGFRLK